jgi:L-fuculose-phosphate aldolase
MGDTMSVEDLYASCLPAREELAYFMRRLYECGLTTCSGGNLSVRIDEAHAIITPSALDKGRMTPEQIGLMTLSGENLTPRLTASIEAGMHLAVYRTRPDVRAIVHAHPVIATSFSAMKARIDTTLTAEAYAVVGEPALAGYALMGTQALAERVAESVRGADVVLMENHGILAVGNTLLKAFDRLEVLESAAKMTIIARLMGGASPLTPARIEELDALMGRSPGGRS